MFSNFEFDSKRRPFGRRPVANPNAEQEQERAVSVENHKNFKRNENQKKRNDWKKTPRFVADDVAVALSDEGSAAQVAVGGIREVRELLTKEPTRIHRILFKQHSGDSRLYALQKEAKKAHVHVQQVETRVLDQYARPNQGIVALCNERPLLTWSEVRDEFILAAQKKEKKLIAVATNIEDPRNLGACIRSALGLGVDILLIPAKGMCGITPTVAKTSAGALDKLRICRPENLEETVAELKQNGYQILGLDAETDIKLADCKFEDRVVLAVGGEDVGLPPFIKKQCDAVLRIPMTAGAHSYNASVALSLGLYEWARTRLK